MKLILTAEVEHLGTSGDIVEVKDGYGRNFLLPRGLALPVTDSNRATIEREKKTHAAKAAKEKAELETLAARLNGMRYVAPRKVGENDLLYGSVTSGDIAEFLRAKGIDVDKRKIQLEEPIKHLGDYEVKIKLHPEVTATVKVLVTKEG